MKFSLSTGTLYMYPLRTVFRWATETGFEGIELVVNPEAIVRGGQGVRELADTVGTDILSVHPTIVPLRGWRERIDGADPTLRLAQEARARHVVMHTPRSNTLEEGEGLAFLRTIEKWQPLLEGSGLRLAVENKAIRSEADRDYVLTPLTRLRSFADQHELGLVLDTVHAGTAGEDLVEAKNLFNGRLVNVHLSDLGGRVPLGSLTLVNKGLGQHQFPGSGELPLAAFLRRLASDGLDGPTTLEMNPFAVRFWWPPAVRRRLHRSFDWLSKAAGSGPAKL